MMITAEPAAVHSDATAAVARVINTHAERSRQVVKGRLI